MFRVGIMWRFSYDFWMQIGKRIRLEKHYGFTLHGIADSMMSTSMITSRKNYKLWKQYMKIQFNDKFICNYIKKKNWKQYEKSHLNDEFVNNYYIKENLQIVKIQEDSGMSSNLPVVLRSIQSSMVDTYKKENFKEIDVQEAGLWLVGPGNARLTRLLKTLFEWSSTFQLHALYHDVLGRIYLKTNKWPSDTYVFRNYVFKGSSLFQHLTGLLSCILFGKNIGTMIVN